MTTTHTEADQRVIDRVEQELLSGRTFFLIWQARKSAPLGGPAINSRGYGQIIATLGRFAAQGDWHVAAVREAISALNPYVTTDEVIAQVAAALQQFVAEGYYDVIGATGPEASRPSAHQHTVTLRQALLLSMLMVEVEEAAGYSGSVPGMGWCKQALMEREQMTFPQHLFPLHAEARERREASRRSY